MNFASASTIRPMIASHNRLNIIPPGLEDCEQARRNMPDTTARSSLARGRAGVLRNPVYLDRLWGDLLFKVCNNRAADGGAGTALSKTIASAVTSLP